MLSIANDIDEFLEKFNKSKLVELDRNTQKALLSDDFDKVFYSVKDEFGHPIIGEAAIEHRKSLQKNFSTDHTTYYFSELNHQEIRVVSVPAKIKVDGKEIKVYIQVAETLNKRKRIREQILVWILLPQFILLVVAGILFWLGIKRALNPLWAVNDALAKRSYRDLEPIKLDDIPREITRLVDSVNGLMAKLNHTIHAQNRFLADAAHQLRTPLAGTRAQLELANQSQNLPDIKKRLQKISTSTERLIHLINQLLILAKNQSEAIHQINFEPIDLVSFINIVAAEFDLDKAAKNITLSFVGSGKKIIISGERSGLYNLIYNLIDNAIRYTPHGGNVSLDVSVKDKEAFLIVKDNGIGVPKNEHNLIFDRFYRGNQTTEFGTGLGLAIVKEITALHNATIAIDSDVSEGTKITVTFPLFDN